MQHFAYSMLRIVYFGTPDFSSQVLDYITTSLSTLAHINLVVTNPDKPFGRKQILTPSSVKAYAIKHAIPYFDEPIKKSSPRRKYLVEALQQADLALVFAFGSLIDTELLSLTRLGWVNIHPSLLPQYRGASPTTWPLIHGNPETGVSLIKMDAEMDHGPIIIQEKIAIERKTNREKLEQQLIPVCNHIIHDFLQEPEFFLNHAREQEHSQATYTRILTKEDGYIAFDVLQAARKGVPHVHTTNTLLEEAQCFAELPQALDNLYRGIHTWPGLWTKVPIKGTVMRLKLHALHVEDYRLAIDAVQLEGKTIVDTQTFFLGNGIDLR